MHRPNAKWPMNWHGHGRHEWGHFFSFLCAQMWPYSGHSKQQDIGLFCSSFKLLRPVCGRSCDARQVPPHLPRRPPVSEPEPRPRRVSQFSSNIFTIFTDNKSAVLNNGGHTLWLTNVPRPAQTGKWSHHISKYTHNPNFSRAFILLNTYKRF